jgi:hypothetical protein
MALGLKSSIESVRFGSRVPPSTTPALARRSASRYLCGGLACAGLPSSRSQEPMPIAKFARSLAGALGATLVLASVSARAGGDGGGLDAALHDSGEPRPDSSAGHDGSAVHDGSGESKSDAASADAAHPRDVSVAPVVDAAPMCIAIGEPCTASEKCCVSGAYCGSFGGTGNSLVCGQDTANTLPTSSCAAGGGGGADGLLVVLGGALMAAGGRRRRQRARSKTSSPVQ